MSKIGLKIVLVVCGAAFISMLSMLIMDTIQQEETILEENQHTRTELSQSVIHGLKALMMSSSATIAQSYAEEQKLVSGIDDLRIMRVNGVEAYRDNQTILEVNWNRGEMIFPLRATEERIPVINSSDIQLNQALERRNTVSFYETGKAQEKLLTFLTPILSEKECVRCHGEHKEILGVVKLTTSMKRVEDAIWNARYSALKLLILSIILMSALTVILIRYTITQPVKNVTRAMTEVANGDLTQMIPVLGRDELSHMATSFNAMIGKLIQTYTGLQIEQNKLTTIILSAREGIVVTDDSRHVVLVNPAAEKLLQKSSGEIIQGGFMKLVDDPDYINRQLLESETPSPDASPELITYQGRTLHLYAAHIHGPSGDEIGSAALIRDLTEEKKLEEHLYQLSYVDDLTRHLSATTCWSPAIG
ncbi:MAG: HAMP domain-containing protein, partial [Magnetococcales bacterium]|nr:HAMP domain-containing protein [Magnetococcales bacterium]